jgi:hypothetical protein
VIQPVGETVEVRPPNAAIALAIRIERSLDVILGLMLLALVLSLFYQVFGRYVIGRAPGWTEEVARMLVAWMAMLGTGACLRNGGHIAVGVLINSVSPRLRLLIRHDLFMKQRKRLWGHRNISSLARGFSAASSCAASRLA